MRRLSQTAIRTYRTCPQQWKQVYVDGRQLPPAPPLTLGSAVHAGLETFHRKRVSGPAPLADVLAAFEAELDPAAFDRTDSLESARADGRAMLERFYAKHAPGFRPALDVELSLTYDVDDVPMISILDHVEKTPDDRLRIRDYKTGRFFGPEEAEVSEQLTLYQIAAEDRLGLEVEALSLYHVPSLTEWSVPRRSSAEVDAVRTIVVGIASAIERGEFEPRPGRHCAWCHARPWCPAFADEFPENWAQEPAPPAPGHAEAAAFADALGEVRELRRELEEQARGLQERLVAYFDATGERAVAGDRYRVTASVGERFRCDDEVLRAILEPAGLWARVLAPAWHLKARLVDDPEVPADLRRELERHGVRTRSWTLRHAPRRGDGTASGDEEDGREGPAADEPGEPGSSGE
jgi:putative RecB family exonuclease